MDPARVPDAVREWVLQELETLRQETRRSFLYMLGENGELVARREEIITITRNLSSVPAHSGVPETFSDARVKAGDDVAYLGTSDLAASAITGRGLIFHVQSPVAVDGAIETTVYNAHDAAGDRGSTGYRFRLLHPV